MSNCNVINKRTLNELADALFGDIQSFFKESQDNFFAGATVVVPNKKMESWLKAYWLNTKDKVLMNVNFVNIDAFILSTFDIDKNISLAQTSDYKNCLIKLLGSKPYEQATEEIKNYLFDDVNGKKELNATKLNELAATLASLFINYEKECTVITGWQKDYYDSLLNEFGSNLVTLSKLFNSKAKINKNNEPVYLFGSLALDKLYEEILEQYAKDSKVFVYELESVAPSIKKYEISSSPSINKEIEVVHSKICELLKDKDKGLKPSDFLVVGNNISDYENVIRKVFVQDENEGFPSIPFSISGSKNEESNLSSALLLLLDIFNKGFFTRLDFYSLITNPLIQSVRGISIDQVEQWMDCVYNLNVYRGKLSKDDDWDYIRKRLLLSKISNVNFEDNIVSLEGEDYIPYSTIGLDDASIVSFVSTLDDLNSWLNTLGAFSLSTEDALTAIKEELEKWFLNDNAAQADKRYRKSAALIDYWINRKIVAPIKTFLQVLLEETKLKSISYKEPFVTGVTFMEFSDSVVYQQKHIFFINAGSSSLPKKIIKSELDLRSELDNSKETKAFQLLYQVADCFHISFVGMDLKKDAELFESTLSKELRIALNPKAPGVSEDDYEKQIKAEIYAYSIEEKRNWDKLYTRGEYNRKDYYEGLSSLNPTPQSVSNSVPIDPDGEKQERRNKISTSDIAKYLEEPLSYKAKYLFGEAEDDDESNHEEYEPFALDTLQEHITITKICELQADYIKNGQINSFDYDDYKEQLKLENKLLRIGEDFSAIAFAEAESKADDVINGLGIKDNPTGFEIVQLDDLLMDNNGEEWVLVCRKRFVRRIDGNKRYYYELKPQKELYSKALNLYACSLMDVASLNDTNTYEINICFGSADPFEITSARAVELLNMIFNAINDFSDKTNRFSYLDFSDNDVKSFKKLMNFIASDNGKWNYFPYTKLFNVEDETGYDKDNYEIENYYDSVNKVGELIEFYEEKEPTVLVEGESDNASI